MITILLNPVYDAYSSYLYSWYCSQQPSKKKWLILLVLMEILCSYSLVTEDDDDDNLLHIGGIFPIAGEGGWQGGQVNLRYL